MLIMRIYALYERSRKVLALYVVVAAAIVIAGCVSRENQRLVVFESPVTRLEKDRDRTGP